MPAPTPPQPPRVVLALDIGGTAIKSALIDACGHLTAFAETPSDGLEGAGPLLSRLTTLVSQYDGFDAIAVSTAGQVDRRTGTIAYGNANIPGYAGTPLAALLGKAGHHVTVLNDAEAAALGELWYGAATGSADFLLLTFGTGIGGAVVLGGQLFTGAHGRAGELGHFVTHAGGEQCACGGYGCFERYASTLALTRTAQALDPSLIDGRTIVARWEAGEAAATKAVDAWVAEVGLGVASLVHLFDPEKVILGGGIMASPHLTAAVRTAAEAALMPHYRDVAITPAQLGNQAALYGAAYASNHPQA